MKLVSMNDKINDKADLAIAIVDRLMDYGLLDDFNSTDVEIMLKEIGNVFRDYIIIENSKILNNDDL